MNSRGALLGQDDILEGFIDINDMNYSLKLRGGKGNTKSKNRKSKRKVQSSNASSRGSTGPNVAGLLEKPEVRQQLAVMIFSVVSSQIISRINFKDSTNLRRARFVFIAYALASQATFSYMRSRVKLQRDRRLVPAGGAATLTGLPIPGAPSATTTTSPTTSSSSGVKDKDKGGMTIEEYDLAEIARLSSSVLLEMVTTSYMHFYKKSCKPLLFVPLMGVINKLRAPIVQVHLWGRRPTKKRHAHLRRPFRSGFESILAGFMPAIPTPTATATATAAPTATAAASATASDGGDGDDAANDLLLSNLSLNTGNASDSELNTEVGVGVDATPSSSATTTRSSGSKVKSHRLNVGNGSDRVNSSSSSRSKGKSGEIDR